MAQEENSTGTPQSPQLSSAAIGQWLIDNESSVGSDDYDVMAKEYQRIKSQEQTPIAPVVAPAPTEDVGFIAGIGEAFSGSRRGTEETRTLPSYQEMPEFNSVSTMWPTAKVAVGTMMGSTDEMAKVISAQFPDITIRKDENGNNILTSPIDGLEYAIKPGMELSDIPRGLSSAALFALLKGRGMIGSALQQMAIQAGYESTQKGLGGDFNILDVGLAGALPVVFSALKRPVQLAWSNTIGRLIKPGIPPATVVTATLLSDEELVDVARRAAANDQEAIRLLAEMSAPDEKVLEAARRLGIEDFLQPDHYTTDQGFRELSQIAKSNKPSKVGAAETKGLIQVGQRAFDLIEELGGDVDLSRMNQQVRDKMRSLLDDLGPIENTQWDNVRSGVGEANRFNPAKIMEHLEQRIINVGGDVKNLSSLEQYVYSKLKPKEIYGTIGGSKEKILLSVDDPTFTLIDDVRRTVGAATKGGGEIGATSDTGMAKLLYGILDDDVKDIAYSAGQRDLYDMAKATTRQIVGLESDLTSLFGKQLANSMVPKLGNSIGALTKGDADTFVRLINNVPEEMRAGVVASGLQGAFGRATLDGALNFNSYAKWYDGLLRNRVAMNTMFKYLPNGARKQLSDLYRVAKAVNLSTSQRVRTGRPIQNALEGDTLLGKFYSVGRRAAIGLPIEAAAIPLGLGGTGIASGITAAVVGGHGMKKSTIQALDEIMASPQFSNALASIGTEKERAAVKALAASRPFASYMRSVNLPASEAEQFIMGALQSARSGASDVSTEVPVVEEAPQAVAPPQASVSSEMLRRLTPPAPPSRGLPWLEGEQQPAQQAPAPPPRALAQAPSQSSQMMDQLFPYG